MSNSPDYLYFQQLWLTKSKYLRVLFKLKNGKVGTILYRQCLLCIRGSQIEITRQGLFNFRAETTGMKKLPFPIVILVIDLFYFILSKTLIDCLLVVVPSS